jgi:hypothetical protein
MADDGNIRVRDAGEYRACRKRQGYYAGKKYAGHS